MESKFKPIPQEPIVRSPLSVNFGLFTGDEIRRMSVVPVTSPKFCGENSLGDCRMGSLERDTNCLTCHQSYIDCPGHFGHIELNIHIFHPFYLKELVDLFTIFCDKCSSLVLSYDTLILKEVTKYSGFSRVKMIADLVSKKVNNCEKCHEPHPTFFQKDDKIYYYYDQKEEKFPMLPEKAEEIFDRFVDHTKVIPDPVIPKLTRHDDSKLFKVMKLIGLKNLDPRALILSVLPVMPPRARPFVETAGLRRQDDLSGKYSEIVKINNKIVDLKKTPSLLRDMEEALIFHISTLFDNTKGKAKAPAGKPRRPLKGIADRLGGKQGRFRHNLLGKRCDFTSRTVLGPGPELKVTELGVPREIAKILTIPVTVQSYNLEECQRLMKEQKINSLTTADGKNIRVDFLRSKAIFSISDEEEFSFLAGDKILGANLSFDPTEALMLGKKIVPWSGTKDEADPTTYHRKIELPPDAVLLRKGKAYPIISKPIREIKLKVGDTIHRQLQDGDYVLHNRQPTLHKGSMLGHKVRLHDYHTFTLNLADCGTYNADFDGDETNIHVPQDLLARTELQELVSVEKNVILPSSSGPVFKICQDAASGGYALTYTYIPLNEREVFYAICCKIDWELNYIEKRITEIKQTLKLEGYSKIDGKDRFPTGHDLFSMLLPSTFNYKISAPIPSLKDLKELSDTKRKLLAKLTSSPSPDPEKLLAHLAKGSYQDQIDRVFNAVIIKHGVLLQGVVTSSLVGQKSSSLIVHLARLYGPQVAVDFVNNYQTMTTEYLLVRGFSVGLGDLIFDKSSDYVRRDDTEYEREFGKKHLILDPDAMLAKYRKKKKAKDALDVLSGKISGKVVSGEAYFSDFPGEPVAKLDRKKLDADFNRLFRAKKPQFDPQVREAIVKKLSEANSICFTSTDRRILENRINACLNRAKDIGQVLSVRGLKENNSLNIMVRSGAKGSLDNIAQLVGLLGQQNVDGKRFFEGFAGRTLPHYPFGDKFAPSEPIEMKYQSHGFITASFVMGLSPDQFWFHAAGGREGLICTAMATAKIGYAQHRMARAYESIIANPNGMVLDEAGNVLQWLYGNDGLDPSQMSFVKGKPQFINLDFLNEKLNVEYESSLLALGAPPEPEKEIKLKFPAPDRKPEKKPIRKPKVMPKVVPKVVPKVAPKVVPKSIFKFV